MALRPSFNFVHSTQTCIASPISANFFRTNLVLEPLAQNLSNAGIRIQFWALVPSQWPFFYRTSINFQLHQFHSNLNCEPNISELFKTNLVLEPPAQDLSNAGILIQMWALVPSQWPFFYRTSTIFHRRQFHSNLISEPDISVLPRPTPFTCIAKT